MSMIAEYQNKFAFTAILISHDLPDVSFISNRILALHGGKIIFQGTPEEFDEFEHPSVDEFIKSLEAFQEHLTGLYSKRSFKVRYQKALARKHPHERFVAVTFSIDELVLPTHNFGHVTVQKMIKALGAYINKHFGAVGGFSTRQGRDLFITVLPFSDLQESEQIIEDFARDLRQGALMDIQAGTRIPPESCFEFFVSAGLAEGRSDEAIESVIETANSRRKTIARFECKRQRYRRNERVHQMNLHSQYAGH